MNCFKIHTANREFSLYGGLLYLDGTPVQSYFSKNMFYWEAEKERGALYLYHHGLMAQVVLQKDGVREIHNASTEQHYTISRESPPMLWWRSALAFVSIPAKGPITTVE